MQKIHSTVRYDREVFTMRDGGTIALDWIVGKDKRGRVDGELAESSILVILAGLAGERDNGYNFDVIREGLRRGYKIVLISYRGTAGMKLTSGKMYNLMVWEDIKEPIDYIYEKYCQGNGRKIHAYAVSLGANVLGHYMINEQEKSKLTSVATFGNLFNTEISGEFFCK